MPPALEEPLIFQPGQPFLHYHYDVEAFLGAGASGQVYVIRHRFTGERFALKVAHLADRGSAAAVARSLAEAQATYRIQHRNVVRVIDLACERDGMVWQIMELLQGHSVGDLLARHGRFSPLYAIDIAIEVAWGLHEAHEHQVIHRDVHPLNVFITRLGEVKVLDFSLAKIIPAGLETTRDNRAKGTLPYMAPEHLRQAQPTPQFDVFGLGILLWQMLVGRTPFDGCPDNALIRVQKQLTEDPESLVTAAGLPACCDEVLRGATARDPRRRYAGMWPFAQALRALQERLRVDPAVLALQAAARWERQVPIVSDVQGRHQYRAARSLPGESPAQQVPSRRIVVSPRVSPVPAATIPPPVIRPTRPVAATVPMAAYPESGSPDIAAPTVRGGPRPRSRRPWVGLAVVLAVAVLGAGVALVLSREAWRAAPSPAVRAPAQPAPPPPR